MVRLAGRPIVITTGSHHTGSQSTVAFLRLGCKLTTIGRFTVQRFNCCSGHKENTRRSVIRGITSPAAVLRYAQAYKVFS